jgi:hypothetical protein
MQKDDSFWSEWAQILHQWGLREIAAELLEASGPIHIVLAQFVYAGRPVLQQVLDEDRYEALASLFEDQNATRSFAAYLREEISG